jgi:hypothetical protein
MQSTGIYAIRAVATIVIWVLLTVMIGFVMASSNAGDSVGFLVAILALAAASSTWALWQSSDGRTASFGTPHAEKGKRSPKQRLLNSLNALDEDEAAAVLEDMRTRLHGGNSDGELSAVDVLRAERR